MRSLTKKIATLLTALALLGGSLAAQAVTVRVDGYQAGSDPVDTSISGEIEAGAFEGALNGFDFETYCANLFLGISFGTTYSNYQVQDGVLAWGQLRADGLAHLFSWAYGLGLPRAYDPNWVSGDPTYPEDEWSAVIQAAVWEILYETLNTGPSWNLKNGDFRASSTDTSTNQLLTNLNWNEILNTRITYRVDRLYNGRNQDLLWIRPVPEPGSLALFGLGLIGLGLARRRKLG